MPPGIPEGAMCVQRFDDSRNSAIHITYRISLRSSSMPEPRDPLLKVLTGFCLPTLRLNHLWRFRRISENHSFGERCPGVGERSTPPGHPSPSPERPPRDAAATLQPRGRGPPRQPGSVDKNGRVAGDTVQHSERRGTGRLRPAR